MILWYICVSNNVINADSDFPNVLLERFWTLLLGFHADGTYKRVTRFSR